MRVNILPAAHPNVMTMMNFPEISNQTRDWVSQQLNQATSTINAVGQSFLNTAMQSYQHLIDGSLTRSARKIARLVNGMSHPNTIVELDTISAVQSAKPLMQRYIMACPELRTIYHKQLCDGYSDSYVDQHPGIIGEDHYDYRRVMNGIVQFDQEGNWKAVEYFEELSEGDRELEAYEQFAILDTFSVVKQAIAKRIDPTDIFNSDLGI